ncbi:hypothetical protein RB623_06820 [Mesorhizobium sp. LHD-90]|uniref:hypothetical protein n=1 Tax=Mesorhizobium sp. LHD-90 TaxID=3071414 RepID=UPI0027E06425|nr:hypothetical protein [Mesorhizobium sp. LHD-90]MDQ6433763.1 hypothetical protein [Mesorhizobium sp. LHD-90]
MNSIPQESQDRERPFGGSDDPVGRLNPRADVGRPTAEMLLALPKFVTGKDIFYGVPVPFRVQQNKQPSNSEAD